MRPSQEPNVLFVLDRKTELELVLEYLEDNSAEKPEEVTTAEDITNTSGYRFRTQTLYELPYPHAQEPGEDKWKSNAEFQVEARDVELVKRAAERVLEQKGMANRFYNQISRRDKAARHILEIIASFNV